MPDQPFTRLPASLMSLSLLASCATALANPPASDPQTGEVTALRTLGPPGLATLLGRYDTMPAGPARDQLADRIDRVAGQRYATTSRMYWYTDLETAKAAARAQRRPILALRMLGRLDEDLSCANSRLFRATLYANKDVSQFLRDNFILYWSSERDVPRITIEFGDGRKIASTTTGNSAHYVLDAEGTVLDVLPGLYAPVAFKTELTKSLELARTVAKIQGNSETIDRYRNDVIARYHRTALETNARRWSEVSGLRYLPGRDVLTMDHEVESAIARAQRATISKAYIEVPQLGMIFGTTPGDLDEHATDQWAAIGQYTWQIGQAYPVKKKAPAKTLPTDGTIPITISGLDRGVGLGFGYRGGGPARRPPLAALPKVIDDASRALVARLHDAGPTKAKAEERDLVIARLEHHLVADSALNELKLRPQIRTYLLEHPGASFDATNRFIYTNVFHTPREDAWLGLLPRTDFTGLPGDGVVMP